MKAWLSLLIVLLVCGCSNTQTTPELPAAADASATPDIQFDKNRPQQIKRAGLFSSIRKGMTRDQVIEVLGKPDQTGQSFIRYWAYPKIHEYQKLTVHLDGHVVTTVDYQEGMLWLDRPK